MIETTKKRDRDNSNPNLTFGAYLGLVDTLFCALYERILNVLVVFKGVTAYIKKNYTVALGHLCEAVKLNPDCGAGPRIAIAVCSMKLKQYERAGFALEKALQLDVSPISVLFIFFIFCI